MDKLSYILPKVQTGGCQESDRAEIKLCRRKGLLYRVLWSTLNRAIDLLARTIVTVGQSCSPNRQFVS